jgi:hypothetical protein
MTRGGKGLRRESEPRTEAEMVFPTICAVAAASGCGSEAASWWPWLAAGGANVVQA